MEVRIHNKSYSNFGSGNSAASRSILKYGIDSIPNWNRYGIGFRIDLI